LNSSESQISGGDDLAVVVAEIELAHEIDQRVVDHRTFRQEVRHRRGEVREVDEVELLAELAVIAGLRVLDLLEIRVELFLVGPGGAVDPLQHRVPLVAAPVRAGDRGQLERAEAAGRWDVRSAAEIEPFALAIDRQRLIAGDALNDLHFVFFAQLLERPDRLFARPLLAADRQIATRDLGHLLFDAAQVLIAERTIGAEVVEEAVLDHRSDRDLGAGEELLHGHRHEVGGGVPDRVDACLRLRSHDLDLCAVGNGRVDVDDLAVDLARDRVPGQTFADRCGDVGDGRAFGDFFHRAIWKLNVHVDL